MILPILYIVLILGDILSTYYGLNYLNAREMNKYVVWMINHVGFWGYALIYLSCGVVLSFIAHYLPNLFFPDNSKTLTTARTRNYLLLIALWSIPITNNLYEILKML